MSDTAYQYANGCEQGAQWANVKAAPHERIATLTEADVEAIETAADALIRSRDTQTAITLYALALRLRSETGIHPKRRADDRP